MEIAFLIRIKEGVGQPGLECEAFAASAAAAICAERGDELILASAAFTQICAGALPNPSMRPDGGRNRSLKNCCSNLN